jgi:hypothetical protein
MEKDIDRITKNAETDIVIRIDDFGGKTGLTIREFVKSERYTGFTKAGTRIPAEYFKQFKEAINMIDEGDLVPSEAAEGQVSEVPKEEEKKEEVKVEDNVVDDSVSEDVAEEAM